MPQFLIRYRIKPDQATVNDRLIRAVFAELHDTQPAGLGWRLPKGTRGTRTAPGGCSWDTGSLDVNAGREQVRLARLSPTGIRLPDSRPPMSNCCLGPESVKAR